MGHPSQVETVIVIIVLLCLKVSVLCLPRFWGEPDWTVRQLKEAIEEATSYTVFVGKEAQDTILALGIMPWSFKNI